MSKQTTIIIDTLEEIVGLTIRPFARHWGQGNEFHRKAWELLTGKSDLSEKFLNYPEANFDPQNAEEFAKYTAWEKATLERIDRVVRNRAFKTKVEILRARPDGTPFQWKVTVYWNRPKNSEPNYKPAPGIEQALRSRSSRHGANSACCLTGKDADLETHGEQNINVKGYLGNLIVCEATIGKSFAGSDVCLNLPEDKIDEEFIEKAKDAWLEQAGEVISECSVPGEWSGDDWYLFDRVEFRVRVRKTLGQTADAITAKAQKVLAPLEKELAITDEILNALSGWTDGKGHAFPEGQPGEGSIGFYLANQASILSEEDLDWQARNQQEGK